MLKHKKTTKSSLKIAILASLCLLGTVACNEVKETVGKKDLAPPMENVNIDFTTFKVEVSKGGTFTMKNGSEITVPANAFKDETGLAVTGEVTLNYREFHDAADIFVSGIPMKVNEKSDKYLETAGMFEIRAEQNGKKVDVQDGKSIQVQMSSYVDDGCYNQFYLDETSHSWELIGEDVPSTNPRRIELEEELKKLKPKMKMPLGKGYFTLSQGQAYDVYFNEKYQDGSRLNYFKKEMKAYNLELVEFVSYDVITFKGKKVLASEIAWTKGRNVRFPNWTKDGFISTRLRKIRGNQYELVVFDVDSDDVFKTKITAEMFLKTLFGKSGAKWTKEYQAYLDKKKALQDEINMTALVNRFYEVDKMGIYNTDRFYKTEDNTMVLANFEAEGSSKMPVKVNYISTSGRAIIPLDKIEKGVTIPLSEQEKLVFFTVIDHYVYVFDKKDFSKIDFSNIKMNTNPTYDFKLKKIEDKVETLEDLKKILGV